MPFRRSSTIVCALLYMWSALYPSVALAQTGAATSVSSFATAVTVRGTAVAYGDIIDFDAQRGVYVLSQYPDDSHFFGVAVKDPPLLYVQGGTSTVPVAKDGIVLVNVTLENGPINAGDNIIASSIPGKGMRAFATSTHPIGVAVESFDGSASTSVELPLGRKMIRAGTIAVDLDGRTHAVAQTALSPQAPPQGDICLWQCVPFGTLMRYLTAALVSFGSVYLAFRTFMADAVSGVTSIGRNPRARASIQSMVVFNAILSMLLALAGLIAGIVILFIKL